MEYKNYLWYIIPGTLFLLPLAPINRKIPILNGIDFLIVAFAAGYIIHTVYRIGYHFTGFRYRSLIRFLKHKLKGIDITTCWGQTDYLYNLYIFSSNEFQSPASQIRTQSQMASSLFSCGLGAILGEAMNYMFFHAALFHVIYWIITPILFLNYCIVFAWMNNNEKVLVSREFDEKFKKNKDKIAAILKDVK